MTKHVSKEINDLEHVVRQHLSRGYDARKYFNFTQIQILKYLFMHENEEVCQKDLEIETHLKKASMSGSLDSLEYKEAIARKQSDNDKRRNVIKLTDKAKQKIKELEENVSNLEEILTRNVSQEELEIFYNVIDKMKNNLKKEG